MAGKVTCYFTGVYIISFHDKVFIKSFIKNLTKGRNPGISDDFPKEVEEMRKKLYPVLKAAKQEKRTVFFKVIHGHILGASSVLSKPNSLDAQSVNAAQNQR